MTNKPFFDKIFLIFTCNSDIEYVEKLKEDYRFQNITHNSKILFVIAGKSKTYLDKEFLYLDHKECYDNLPLKTYKSIKYCYENFKFNYLIKMDCNIFDYASICFQKNLFKLAQMFEPKEIYNKLIKLDYIDEYGGYKKIFTTKELLENWYNNVYQWKKISNSLNFDIFKYKDKIPYFQGKYYYINTKFAEYISNNGKKLSHYFSDNLPGTEDAYVGLLYEIYLGNDKDIMNKLINKE